jgi:hypothetical protein
MFVFCLPGLLLLGCAAEAPSTGLEIATASKAEGLSGSYRAEDGSVRFETVRDAGGQLAARFFDESGWSIVERVSAKSNVFDAVLPTDEVVAEHEAEHRRAAQLVHAAAATIAEADLVGIDEERDALVEIGHQPTFDQAHDASPVVAAATTTAAVLRTDVRCTGGREEQATIALQNDINIARSRSLRFNFTRANGSVYSDSFIVPVPAFAVRFTRDWALPSENMTSVTVNAVGSQMYAWVDANWCQP